MNMGTERQWQKDQTFLDVAIRIGLLGTCDRAHVGAVITRDGRAVSWGYNGAPSGAPHCDENDHGWRGKFAKLPDTGRRKMEALNTHGCRNATHAEANALAFAARQGISTDNSTLYVERTPCGQCARLLIAAGVRRVVCAIEYRNTEGLELLRQAGVEVVKLA